LFAAVQVNFHVIDFQAQFQHFSRKHRLGFPILDDPLYNSTAFGPNKGAGGDFGGLTDEELINVLLNKHNAENWLEDDSGVGENGETVTLEQEELLLRTSKSIQTTDTDFEADQSDFRKHRSFDYGKMTFDPHCLECRRTYKNPTPEELIMCLHVWKYQVSVVAF
jgi:hypothetical protein